MTHKEVRQPIVEVAITFQGEAFDATDYIAALNGIDFPSAVALALAHERIITRAEVTGKKVYIQDRDGKLKTLTHRFTE